MMVGRSLGQAMRADSAATEEASLRRPWPGDRRGTTGLDLVVHRGEIVGLWGMPGSGRTELMRAVYGLDPVQGGEVEIEGQALDTLRPDRLISLGCRLVTRRPQA